MRILVLQETDWVDRNPVMHHRMLESLSAAGDEVIVLDHEILWHERAGPLVARRSVRRDVTKVVDGSSVIVIRPAMLRLTGLSRLTWLASDVREIATILRDRRPDVVVGYGISDALLGRVLAARAGIPFVYHVLDALHTLAEPAVLRPIARAVERAVMQRADRVIVIGEGLARYALRMGADRDRVEVIPAGHEPAAVPPSLGPGVRRALGIADDELVLLYVGWLYGFCGMDRVLLDLAARGDDRPPVRCVVVGDGDLLERLHAIRRDASLGDRAIILGRRPAAEIAGYIAAADICLLPSRRVPAMEHVVPMKVSEYMEHGRPVVATRLPGIEAEFGSLPGIIHVDDPGGVIVAVERIARDAAGGRAAAARLGRSNARFIAARGDWDDVTRRFRAILADPTGSDRRA